MKFEFKAFTQEGVLKEGIINAENKDEALKLLQEQNLLVTYLSEKKVKLDFLFNKPSLKDLYIFTKQLSYLLKARTPLDEAVKGLSESTTKLGLKSILIEIYNDLISGINFSQALSRFPDIFNSYYIGMIRIGETIGGLDDILYYLSEHLNSQIKFRNRILQASIYPAIVVFLFIGVLLALFYFVIPQIAGLFAENNIPMPFITRFFKNIADFLLNFGFFLLIIIGFLIYFFFDYIKTREGKVALFKFVSNVPIISNLVKNIYLTQFLESFYYLIRGGVPIVEALDIIKTSINHPLYETSLDYIIDSVKRGNSLNQSLAQFPELFPSLVIEAMKTAEKTGQSVEIVLTIFNFYNETVDQQTANLNEILQPILIIILGVSLGFLEASLLIPILNLTKQIQAF